jgi:hypothetical protein
MRDQEQAWMMFVGAALAGGQSAKQAVESADKALDAAKSRFPEPSEDDDR